MNGAEIENLTRSLGLVTEGLRGDLKRASAVVRDAVAHMVASCHGLEGVVETQRLLLSGMTASLNQSADKWSTLLRGFIEQVVRVSGTSMQIIEQLMTLSEHVDLISKDSTSIDQLARESRFIAFNARIETQRAGQAGATFKVVADEIKRLAGDSASLSSHIRQEVSACATCLELIRKTTSDLASYDMNSASESRSGLLTVVRGLDEVNANLEVTVRKVGSLIADVTAALQFEDTLTQLLDGTMKMVSELSLLTTQAFGALNAAPNGTTTIELQVITRQLSAMAESSAVPQVNLV